ncbi:TPA: integrating conjugative element protein [Pseudomonas aeruginosa]
MTNRFASSPRLRRHLALLAAPWMLVCIGASAQTSVSQYDVQHQGTVISDDVLYSIGGGRAVSMTPAASMRSLGVGVGWNSNLMCGDMSISTTIQNQLNGVTNGFQTIMSSVIQNATAAVASLPALIIQRADPGLYNLLTNGVLQARLDFDRSKLACRAMAEKMADFAGGQVGWSQLADGMVLTQAVASNDAVSAIEQTETSRGNDGVTWIGGNNAGGTGQSPIRVISDVTRAGYNLINGRDVEDDSSIDAVQCGGNLTCQTWSSPAEASAWAVRVLGEQEQRTCETCNKTVSTPGVGLTPQIQEEYEAKLEALQALISGSRPLSLDNLQAAGSTSLPITRGVIEALRDEPDQDILARRLASEIALSSVLERALLLQRTLLTGRKEPNVAANDLAQKAVSQESDLLDREIHNLKTELELRRELASNSPSAIIQRHSARSAGSRTIYEGDPVPDRLDQLQRPAQSGGTP